MEDILFKISGLDVEVDGKKLLKNINLTVKKNEVVCLFGPNGAGKSTLLYSILGYPQYKVTNGEILFKGQELNKLTIDERVRLGLGIAFQHAPRLRGIKLSQFLNLISNNSQENRVSEIAKTFKMDSFLERDVNSGFSGGEIKRSEILQLAVSQPQLLLLDEPDSGVDVENVELLSREIQKLTANSSALVITHVGYILNFINADRAIVLYDGKIACEGDPYRILKDIKDKGYKGCLECPECQKPTKKN